MPQRYQYLFKIDAYTPQSIPMARLAEYMAELAAMLGHEENVHFVKLQSGSTILVNEIEREAFPKVRERVHLVRANEAPPGALKAYRKLNDLLMHDNASAVLIPPEGTRPILKFPGREREKRLVYGPFNQDGVLDGILIRIGGESDPVPVHLQQAEDKLHICEAKRTVAMELAPYYLKCPLRVTGNGRWFRDEDGEWVMKRFTILHFEPLKDEKLSAVLNRLRAIKTDLSQLSDPVSEMLDLRREA
jgi:hypothetical protein